MINTAVNKRVGEFYFSFFPSLFLSFFLSFCLSPSALSRPFSPASLLRFINPSNLRMLRNYETGYFSSNDPTDGTPMGKRRERMV